MSNTIDDKIDRILSATEAKSKLKTAYASLMRASVLINEAISTCDEAKHILATLGEQWEYNQVLEDAAIAAEIVAAEAHDESKRIVDNAYFKASAS